MVILEVAVIAYFAYVVAYAVIFSISGLFYKTPLYQSGLPLTRFAVLIPSYREDAVILDVARKALRQSYPSDHFHVFVIADSLQPDTIAQLKKLPITVVEVFFENSTKVKSLNSALSMINESQFDYGVILDADNVMAIDFLHQMNSAIITQGYAAVQGQRKPKNQNNNLAFLDGVSEAINNHIYRQGQMALGLSSSISGSGVAFKLGLLKEKLAAMTSIGGFDRELELRLLLEGIKVKYHKAAIVFDEKTSSATAFKNQRRRWISSQYFYLRKYLVQGLAGLVKGDITFFNSAVLRNIQLPRVINLGFLTLLAALSFFIDDYLTFGKNPWVLMFACNTVAILIAIPGEFYSRKMIGALLDLPGIFFRMFMLLFKLKNANKKFIHTPHAVTTTSTE